MNSIDRRRFNAMLAGLDLAGAMPALTRNDFHDPRNLTHGTDCNRHIRSEDVARRPRHLGDRRLDVGRY